MTKSDQSAQAAGITTKDSPLSVDETVSRLVGLIEARGMKVFAVIDQAEAARGAGLDLRPTTMVIFGNPAAGTRVMEAAPWAAMDLPLRVLIWADGEQTKVGYVAPSTLDARYHLGPDLTQNLAGVDPLTDALITR
jgi:uncharacterized protein (DUF302 family)